MPYYHPCKNCAISAETCHRRAEISNSISGLSVTSIKFKCNDRLPRFKEGQRVSFVWRIFDNVQIAQDAFDTTETETRFHGTVVFEKSNKLRFIVRVDETDNVDGINPREVFKNENLIISIRPDDMTEINEPQRSLCQSCMAYDKSEAKTMCQGFNGGPWDIHDPEGCLLSKEELR